MVVHQAPDGHFLLVRLQYAILDDAGECPPANYLKLGPFTKRRDMFFAQPFSAANRLPGV